MAGKGEIVSNDTLADVVVELGIVCAVRGPVLTRICVTRRW